MKAIKYLFMGVLMTGFSTTAMAQDGSKADVDAVKRIISSKPADLKDQMKAYYKKNKKNVENLVAFSRAFLDVKDTANARQYANYALEASKNKCAPAYVLLGDIEAIADNGGGAASYYDQAIYTDPKAQEAYYKYALVYRKIDPQGAAAKLDQLKENCPDVEVDAIKGHIFYITDKIADSYDSYSKVPVEKMDKGNLIEFASVCFFMGKYDDGLKAVAQGQKLSPRNATFNRLGMMFNVEKKDYEAAVKFVDKLFNASDSLEATNTEYYYAGLSYAGLKQYDKAIEEYQKALNVKSEKNLIKPEIILKSLSDLYLEKEDIEQAIKYYQEFLAKNEKATFNDHEGHANLHTKWAETMTDAAAKEEALKKADAIYEDMAKRFNSNHEYILYKRANIANKLDPDQTKRLAKEHYQALIDRIAPKAEKDNSDKKILVTAYHYMMSIYYLQENNLEKAKEYAAEILKLNPNYEPALNIINLNK